MAFSGVNPSEIRAVLERHGLRLQPALGQNFLIDAAQAEKLVRLAGVEAADTVVEVGTGLGVLTRQLAARAARVISVEVDAGLVRALRAEALLPANVELVHADALALDLAALVGRSTPPVRLVANLPYSAASPLLRRLLDLRESLVDWSVMVQREVGERLLAPPGGRSCGSLGVLHRLCVEMRRELILHPHCFYPAPDVHSSFIRMTPLAESPLGAFALSEVERVVRSAFQMRRKTLANALRPVCGDAAEVFLARAGIDPQLRPEKLDADRWLALARAVAAGA